MIFRHAHDAAEILAAKRLIYDHYLCRMGWQFPENTPTGWRIVTENGESWVDDRYENASRWYVGESDRMIRACVRVIFRDQAGGLDVEHYNHTPAFTDFLAAHPHCIEPNRFAFADANLFTECFLNFLLCILEDAQREGWTVVMTDGMGAIERYMALGIPRLPGTRFKYHPDDPNEVNMYGVTIADIPTILHNCRQMLRNLPQSHGDTEVL